MIYKFEENISFFIDEDNNENNIVSDFNINELLNKEYIFKDEDDLCANFIHYDINYKLKQLLQICEYYGFAKDVKTNKLNKEQIINYLVAFENDIINTDIVFRRQNMWFYINELKNMLERKEYKLKSFKVYGDEALVNFIPEKSDIY